MMVRNEYRSNISDVEACFCDSPGSTVASVDDI
jgi:hypothetical protein